MNSAGALPRLPLSPVRKAGGPVLKELRWFDVAAVLGYAVNENGAVGNNVGFGVPDSSRSRVSVYGFQFSHKR